MEFDPVVRSRLYTGSEIKADTSWKVLAWVLKMHPQFYKEFENWVEENVPKERSKMNWLKDKLIKENVKLGIKENYSQIELKTEID